MKMFGKTHKAGNVAFKSEKDYFPVIVKRPTISFLELRNSFFELK